MGDVEFEYTARDTPQHNYLVEKGFDTLYNKGRAMLEHANVPEHMRLKLFREVLQTATRLDNLAVININGKEQSRYEHWGGALPAFAKHLRLWGEAGVVKLKKTGTPKVAPRGETCMFVGYAIDHPGDCYKMFDQKTMRVHTTRDIRWLNKMYYNNNKIRNVEEDDIMTPDDEVGEDEHEQGTPPSAPVAATSASTTVEGQGEWNEVRRSGRASRAPERLIEEMAAASVITQPEANFYAVLSKNGEDYDPGEVACMAAKGSINSIVEIAAVGAGEGGGFEHTSELKPMKYKEAMATKDKYKWDQAVEEEWNKMNTYGVFEMVPKEEVPADAKMMTTTWAMKKKSNGTYRARVNMRGYEQVDGEHYDSDNIASPVTNDVSVRVCLVLMLMANWYAHIVDVKGAFLTGEFDNDETIYTPVPEGFERFCDSNKYLLKLLKTWYGLKQAAMMFWKQLVKAMTNMKCERNHKDPCMYYKQIKEGFIIWLSWVDDCVCIGPKKEVLEEVAKMKSLFDCTDIGAFKEYVGCKISRSEDNKTLKFTQPVLLQSYKDEFELPSTTFKIPAEPKQVLVKCEEGAELDPVNQKVFRSGVGKLMHMMRWSRPEIWNATREVSRRMTMANEAHMKALKRTMKYCVDTPNRGWTLRPNREWDGKDTTFEFIISGKSDSNYATCKETRRSVTGLVIRLEGAVVAVKSGMQRIVALSVTEAEIIALVAAVQEMLYIMHLIEGMGLSVAKPMVLEVDNRGAVDLINGWSCSGGTKHTEVRIMFVRQLKEAGIISVIWTPEDENESDIFTKNTDERKFEKHTNTMCEGDEISSREEC
jgi:hypothetical protein